MSTPVLQQPPPQAIPDMRGLSLVPGYECEPLPEALCFRHQTIAIIRHYFEISCQVGRLPSILGREFFRARVSHHVVPSFEDQAVFVHDVEHCLKKLSGEHEEIVALVGLYDFSQDEVTAMTGRCRSWVHQHYLEAVDELTELFLNGGLLSRRKPDRRQWQVEYGTDIQREVEAGAEAQAAPKKPCGSVRTQVTVAQSRPAISRGRV
jgi:hypothetical protein